MDVDGEGMKIMLDCSPSKIAEYKIKYDFDFWQLRTPLTQYKLAGVPYGLDNGCFAKFEKNAWRRLLGEARETKPVFVCLPDIVGDARRTLDLFDAFFDETESLPRALVLQDGIANHEIPFNKIDAVFVGGSDNFKISTEAFNACKAAKMCDKWVHVGRVNTAKRVMQWVGLADSIDGSGISRYDHMLEDVLRAIRGEETQQELNLS
jgi:hypothetical protein